MTKQLNFASMVRRTSVMVSIVMLMALAGHVRAGIMAQVGSLSSGNVSLYEGFDSGEFGVDPDFFFPANTFSSSTGFTFDLPTGSFVIWPGDLILGFSSRSLYQDGGADSMSSISLTSGADIQHIEFDVANGFGPVSPQNIWVRAYNDGVAAMSFIFNLPAPATISLWTNDATPFDEIRVQSYGASSVDQLESQLGAASIDNVTLFAPATVPEPTCLAIFGIGAIGLAGFRPRKQKQTA